MGKKISEFINLNLIKGDKGIWMIYFLLCVISLVEIYSAASNLSFESGKHWNPVIEQASFLLLGLLIVLAVIRIPCKYFKLIPIIGMPLVVGMLLYVLFFQGEVNDAARWINLFGIRFQPSEIAKTMLILQVAVILSKVNQKRRKAGAAKTAEERRREMRKAFWGVMVYTAIVCGLILPENFSTAAMLGLVIFALMFVGNIPTRYLLRTLLAALAVAALAVAIMMITPDESLGKYKRALTWKHRVENKFIRHDASDKQLAYNMEEKWQENTSHMAIANSNVIGRGVGNSIERDFLPHAESDFIYSIILEETGIVGGLIVMSLYVSLLIRCWRIAQRSDKYFPAYLTIGLSLMLVVQALVNMAVAVGWAPVTGQTLPLISHGGTSILITSFNIGLILSVSRYVEKKNAEQNLAVEPISVNETEEYANGEGMQ